MMRGNLSRFGSVVVWSVSLAMVLQPCAALAVPQNSVEHKQTNRKSSSVADVQLQKGGTLVGQVVNESGVGSSNSQVTLSNGQQTWQATTGADGWFQFSDLSGGTYQFRTDQQTQMLRVWSHGTAPPRASNGLLVTPPTDVFRGQRVLSPNTNQFFRVAKQRLANPLVLGGVIVTAVAIPVAIHNSDDDPPATP